MLWYHTWWNVADLFFFCSLLLLEQVPFNVLLCFIISFDLLDLQIMMVYPFNCQWLSNWHQSYGLHREQIVRYDQNFISIHEMIGLHVAHYRIETPQARWSIQQHCLPGTNDVCYTAYMSLSARYQAWTGSYRFGEGGCVKISDSEVGKNYCATTSQNGLVRPFQWLTVTDGSLAVLQYQA